MEQQENNGVTPVLVGFIALCVAAVVFLIVKAVGFGIDKYNEYWVQNNTAYGSDVRFLAVKAFDPEKLRPQDDKLRDDALKLLYAHIDGKTLEESGTDIEISQKDFEMIDPDRNVKENNIEWKDLSEFAVVQKDNRAIIAFEYTIIPTQNDKAYQQCVDSYKTRACSRIYLEMADGVWNVTDVLLLN